MRDEPSRLSTNVCALFPTAAEIIVVVTRQSLVSKVVCLFLSRQNRASCTCNDTRRGQTRSKHSRSAFEPNDLLANVLPPRPRDNGDDDDDKDVRGLRVAIDAISAEAVENCQRVQERRDPMGPERRHHTARLQEIPDGVPGRATAYLQDNQHHELHQAAESLWFPQSDVHAHSRSDLRLT